MSAAKPWWRVSKYMNQIFPASDAKKRESESWAVRGYPAMDIFFSDEKEAINYVYRRIHNDIAEAEKLVVTKRNALKRFVKKYGSKTNQADESRHEPASEKADAGGGQSDQGELGG